MDLTDSERRLILERREREAAKAQESRERLVVLRNATEYETWLQVEGRGSSISTFLDEFCCRTFVGLSASEMFRRVELVRAAAKR